MYDYLQYWQNYLANWQNHLAICYADPLAYHINFQVPHKISLDRHKISLDRQKISLDRQSEQLHCAIDALVNE